MQIDMDVITIIGVFFTVVAAFVVWYLVSKTTNHSVTLIKMDTVAARFIALFESHGVQRNKIPRFFGHDLTKHDCKDETALLKKLDTQTLTDAAELFAVNLEWLQGTSAEIYDIPSFYEDNGACEKYITAFKSNRPDTQFNTYVLTAKADKSHPNENNAVILITEVIAHIKKRKIYRYHLAGKTQNDYWKARAYFAVSCGLLIKYGFHPIGKTVDPEWLAALIKGQTLIEYGSNDDWQNFILPSRGTWCVDD
ncbi:MAG: hypothetical protein WBM99_03390, partial [Psychromonas sp.]